MKKNEGEILIKAIKLRTNGQYDDSITLLDNLINDSHEIKIKKEAYTEKARTYETIIDHITQKQYQEERATFIGKNPLDFYKEAFSKDYHKKLNEKIQPYVSSTIECYEKALEIDEYDEELWENFLECLSNYYVSIYGGDSALDKVINIWDFSCNKDVRIGDIIFDRFLWSEAICENISAAEGAIRFLEERIDQIKNKYKRKKFRYSNKFVYVIEDPFVITDDEYERLIDSLWSINHFITHFIPSGTDSKQKKLQEKFKGNAYELLLSNRNPDPLDSVDKLSLIDLAYDGLPSERVSLEPIPKWNNRDYQDKLIGDGTALIRKLIKDVLKKRYGEKWWEEGVAPVIIFEDKKKGYKQTMADKSEKRKSYQLSRHPDQRGFNNMDLYYLDIKDYSKIITCEKNWPLFKDLFTTKKEIDENKKWIKDYLGDFGDLRNQLSHTNIPLKEYQVNRIKSILGAIQECLNASR